MGSENSFTFFLFPKGLFASVTDSVTCSNTHLSPATVQSISTYSTICEWNNRDTKRLSVSESSSVCMSLPTVNLVETEIKMSLPLSSVEASSVVLVNLVVDSVVVNIVSSPEQMKSTQHNDFGLDAILKLQ